MPSTRHLLPFLATAVLLAGCATAGADDDTASGTGSASGSTVAGASTAPTDEFPVEVEHAFGTTEITTPPERVVTWGWGSTEAAIAVGVVPVAVGAQDWTAGAGNLVPWVEEAVEDVGAAPPTVLTDDFTAPPYEEIVAAAPDLILAPYSGIDAEQYALLSEIAPTVAYPEGPWSTPWDEVIEVTAASLGRSAAGDDVLDELRGWFAGQADAHPEFAGVTVANVWNGDGVVSVYTSADPRVRVLTDLGLEVAPAVDALDTDTAPGNFYYELSHEELDRLDADVIISYHSTQEEAEAFMEAEALQAIPAVAAGNVVQVVGNATVSSVSPPTALSVRWGMPDVIDDLAALLR